MGTLTNETEPLNGPLRQFEFDVVPSGMYLFTAEANTRGELLRTYFCRKKLRKRIQQERIHFA